MVNLHQFKESMQKIFTTITFTFLFFNSFSQTDTTVFNSLKLTEYETELWQEYNDALQYKLLDLSKTLDVFINLEEKINKTDNIFLKIDFNISFIELYRFKIEFRKCEKYTKKVDSLLNINNTNEYLKINFYNRKAAFFTQTNQLDSSIFYSELSIDLAYKINYYKRTGSSLNDICNTKLRKLRFAP